MTLFWMAENSVSFREEFGSKDTDGIICFGRTTTTEKWLRIRRPFSIALGIIYAPHDPPWSLPASPINMRTDLSGWASAVSCRWCGGCRSSWICCPSWPWRCAATRGWPTRTPWCRCACRKTCTAAPAPPVVGGK